MTSVVTISGLSKRYWISHTIERARSQTLRSTLDRIVTAPVRYLRQPTMAARPDEFWALRGVDLEIQRGDTVGIVGRNGAGKSTLLKIISRITRPTSGRLRVEGRVGSLLELGIGFNAELSGRENVFLSGVLLGMSRQAVARLLDEIVAFADVEEFLDTPIKRYSSGMLARLAFAVAAHVDAEVLIVDEALSVGDIEFQKRCSDRISRLAADGRTVLFVSHNLATLSSLCRRGVFLHRGQVAADGPIDEVLAKYADSMRQRPSDGTASDAASAARPGEGEVRVRNVRVTAGGGDSSAPLAVGRPVQFAFELSEARTGLRCIFVVLDRYGQAVTRFDSMMEGPNDATCAGLGPRFVCAVDQLLLLPGSYQVNVRLLQDQQVQDHFVGAAFFDVAPGEVEGRPVSAAPAGSVIIPHRWIVPG